MKNILTLVLILISFTVKSQKCDTIINKGIYKSYINYQLREPIYVSYILCKGGGDCNRAKFRFKNDTHIFLESDLDYSHSGYDKGHLANAEDFAGDCKKDELTFRYYNCLPQTPDLNRGIWKVWETKIRKESQQDSLLVICGGKWAPDAYKAKGMAIPHTCWKVVYSIKSKKILHVLVFTNLMEGSTVKETDIKTLQKLLGYKLKLTF